MESMDTLDEIKQLVSDWRWGTDWLGEKSGPMSDRTLILRIEDVLDKLDKPAECTDPIDL
jgi:hypothetical protein